MSRPRRKTTLECVWVAIGNEIDTKQNERFHLFDLKANDRNNLYQNVCFRLLLLLLIASM